MFYLNILGNISKSYILEELLAIEEDPWFQK